MCVRGRGGYSFCSLCSLLLGSRGCPLARSYDEFRLRNQSEFADCSSGGRYHTKLDVSPVSFKEDKASPCLGGFLSTLGYIGLQLMYVIGYLFFFGQLLCNSYRLGVVEFSPAPVTIATRKIHVSEKCTSSLQQDLPYKLATHGPKKKGHREKTIHVLEGRERGNDWNRNACRRES